MQINQILVTIGLVILPGERDRFSRDAVTEKARRSGFREKSARRRGERRGLHQQVDSGIQIDSDFYERCVSDTVRFIAFLCRRYSSFSPLPTAPPSTPTTGRRRRTTRTGFCNRYHVPLDFTTFYVELRQRDGFSTCQKFIYLLIVIFLGI